MKSKHTATKRILPEVPIAEIHEALICSKECLEQSDTGDIIKQRLPAQRRLPHRVGHFRHGSRPTRGTDLEEPEPAPAALGAKIRPAGRAYGIMGGGAKMRDRCLCKTVQKSVSEYEVQINTILEF